MVQESLILTFACILLCSCSTHQSPGPVEPPVVINSVDTISAVPVVSAAPVINSFSPQTGPAHTIVTIFGENFGTSPEHLEVTFGKYLAKIISLSDTILTVQVPAILGTHFITITRKRQHGLPTKSTAPFVVEWTLMSYSKASVQFTNILFRDSGKLDEYSISRWFAIGPSDDSVTNTKYEQIISGDTLQLRYSLLHKFTIVLNNEAFLTGQIPYVAFSIDSFAQDFPDYYVEYEVGISLFNIPFTFEQDGTITIDIPAYDIQQYKANGRLHWQDQYFIYEGSNQWRVVIRKYQHSEELINGTSNSIVKISLK